MHEPKARRRPRAEIEGIKARTRANDFVLSSHADLEAADEEIGIEEIREAILNADMLEHYEDTGRGESCLLLGFVNDRPIHVICGWRHESVLVITVYIPKPPKFINPWTRRR
ncbi:MAG: hypothetical protein CVU38_07800 [Chloroflexi bacterium HGW-Chloroflexi-1]|nr:MAG: hypothetical protein CVU38_07800 [Chloroflexi bacterium HGW-Chloroflexi-1]